MRAESPARAAARTGLLAALVAFGLGLAPAAATAQTTGAAEAVAIVVHRDAPVDGLSFSQLRRIFLGEQQYWPDRTRVTLLVRAPQAYERAMVLDRIYQMTEPQFRQYWIAKIFRAEVSSGPKIVYSTDMIRELISALPGAIAFMRHGDVGPDVKVVPIDGRMPGERGYPLQ